MFFFLFVSNSKQYMKVEEKARRRIRILSESFAGNVASKQRKDRETERESSS
jgi:hypothetical protein